MKKGALIVGIVVIVLLLGVGFFVLSNKGNNSDASNQSSTPSGPIQCDDPPCLGQHFSSCTPAELVMNSGDQSVKISILGLVNEKCHFTMVFGNVTGADCYFNQADLTDKVLNQMFGNNEGQDAIITEACGQ